MDIIYSRGHLMLIKLSVGFGVETRLASMCEGKPREHTLALREHEGTPI